MAKLSKLDLEAVRRRALSTGLQFHVTYGSTGTVRCRLWHHDGIILATAGGGGYDKTGTVLAEAICTLLQPEVFELAKTWAGSYKNADGKWMHANPRDPKRLYGLYFFNEGARFDGACGVREVEKLANALGFDWEQYITGKNSDMFILRKR